MSGYVTLMGAEDVRSAGRSMGDAASEMKSAASSMRYAFESHQRFLEDWLQRFQQVVEAAAKPAL